MPNYVKNIVKFSDKRIMKDCYKDKEELFDFNEIIKMPKTLNISECFEDISVHYAVSKIDNVEREYLFKKLKSIGQSFYRGGYFEELKLGNENIFSKEDYKKAQKKIKEIIKKEKKTGKIDFTCSCSLIDLGVNNLEDLGNIYIKNILDYGADTWYDWCNNNWGTKWNACSTRYINDNEVEFETAWNMPYELFEKISKKYNARVEVAYANEDIGCKGHGIAIFENGKCVKEEEKHAKFACDIWGYDLEDYLRGGE